MSNPFDEQPSPAKSQLAYISDESEAIYNSLSRLVDLRHELRKIALKCDPLAFPSETDRSTSYAMCAGSVQANDGHIPKILTTQNNIKQALEEELDGLQDAIFTLAVLVG